MSPSRTLSTPYHNAPRWLRGRHCSLCCYERFQFAVQYRIDISDLNAGAVVFDHLVWMENVRADLASPFYFGRGTCRETARLGERSGFPHLEQFAAQHLECFFFIGDLASLRGDVHAQ